MSPLGKKRDKKKFMKSICLWFEAGAFLFARKFRWNFLANKKCIRKIRLAADFACVTKVR